MSASLRAQVQRGSAGSRAVIFASKRDQYRRVASYPERRGMGERRNSSFTGCGRDPKLDVMRSLLVDQGITMQPVLSGRRDNHIIIRAGPVRLLGNIALQVI